MEFYFLDIWGDSALNSCIPANPTPRPINFILNEDVFNMKRIFESHRRIFEERLIPLYKKVLKDIENAPLVKINEEQKKIICKVFAHIYAQDPRNSYKGDFISRYVGKRCIEGNRASEKDRKKLVNGWYLTQSRLVSETALDFERYLEKKSITILVSKDPFFDIRSAGERYFVLTPYMVARFDDDGPDMVVRRSTLKEDDDFVTAAYGRRKCFPGDR